MKSRRIVVLTEEDLIARLKLIAKQESQQAVCERYEIDAGLLSHVFNGNRRLPQKVIKLMGYRKIEGYEPDVARQ